MPAASPAVELGVVELDDGVVAELPVALVVPGGGLVGAVALVCPVVPVVALAELGALESLVDVL